jgi:hemoglobin
MMTDEELRCLVDRFYAKVRADEELGPLFNSAIHDWAEHLERMGDFWSSVMLTSGRYKGNPMAAHLKHKAAIEPAMFERWLALWRETAPEILGDAGAAAVIAKAERIAESLQLALFFKLPTECGAVAA